jgi:hypothetical protein
VLTLVKRKITQRQYMPRTLSSAPPSAEPVETESTADTTEKPTKKGKAPRPSKAAGAPSKSDRQPRKKRGPARPHRRLDIEVINTRITKLEKRRLRAKEQLEDATRHVEGYQAERDFREQEAAATAQEKKE